MATAPKAAGGEVRLAAELQPFDDGHFPGGTRVQTQIATYRNRHSSNYVSIFDDLLSDLWCTRIYEYALERCRPWGTFITTALARDESVDAEQMWSNGEQEKAMALVTVRALFFSRGVSLIGPDAEAIHGTAVWCLTSGLTNEVRYHLDYAELHRYETNVIYPPLYAGTYQASPVYSSEDMVGGDFYANTEGLEHYRRFGYKGKLASEEEFDRDFRTSSAWVRIPYRRNRGTFCDGNLPHLASQVQAIRDGLKRVILGFNAFPAALAECCERAPEHSDAFNRTIKIYQALAAAGLPITTHSGANSEVAGVCDKPGSEGEACAKKKGFNVKDVMKNPVLAKMIVTAARKVREEQQGTQVTTAALKQHAVSKTASTPVPYGY